jgi:hypothetical protein
VKRAAAGAKSPSGARARSPAGAKSPASKSPSSGGGRRSASPGSGRSPGGRSASPGRRARSSKGSKRGAGKDGGGADAPPSEEEEAKPVDEFAAPELSAEETDAARVFRDNLTSVALRELGLATGIGSGVGEFRGRALLLTSARLSAFALEEDDPRPGRGQIKVALGRLPQGAAGPDSGAAAATAISTRATRLLSQPERHAAELAELVDRYGTDRLVCVIAVVDEDPDPSAWRSRNAEERRKAAKRNRLVQDSLGLQSLRLSLPTQVDGLHGNQLWRQLKRLATNHTDVGAEFGSYFLLDSTGCFVGRYDGLFPNQLEAQIAAAAT